MIYLVSKLFTIFLLPPGLFITLLILPAFYVNEGKVCLLVTALLVALFSSAAIGRILLYYFEAPYNRPIQESSDCDAVVVLGGTVAGEGLDLPLTDEAFKRSAYALLLAKKYNLPLLHSGTLQTAEDFLDSMRTLSALSDVPVQIFTEYQKKFGLMVESQSLDTYENADLTLKVLRDAGVEHPKIYLVTSAYHMRRSVRLFEYFGFSVIPAATGFVATGRDARALRDFFPSMGDLEKSYRAFHEAFGLLSLAARGI